MAQASGTSLNQTHSSIVPSTISSFTVYDPNVPFDQSTGRIYPGKMFYISGIPNQNPTVFRINFKCGNDIAFHIAIRFRHLGDCNVIVRNSIHNKVWGQPERYLTGKFPFEPDAFFEMTILVEPSCFKVIVNNCPLLEFMHRVPVQCIDTLHIGGDIRLTQVRC